MYVQKFSHDFLHTIFKSQVMKRDPVFSGKQHGIIFLSLFTVEDYHAFAFMYQVLHRQVVVDVEYSR